MLPSPAPAKERPRHSAGRMARRQGSERESRSGDSGRAGLQALSISLEQKTGAANLLPPLRERP